MCLEWAGLGASARRVWRSRLRRPGRARPGDLRSRAARAGVARAQGSNPRSLPVLGPQPCGGGCWRRVGEGRVRWCGEGRGGRREGSSDGAGGAGFGAARREEEGEGRGGEGKEERGGRGGEGKQERGGWGGRGEGKAGRGGRGGKRRARARGGEGGAGRARASGLRGGRGGFRAADPARGSAWVRPGADCGELGHCGPDCWSPRVENKKTQTAPLTRLRAGHGRSHQGVLFNEERQTSGKDEMISRPHLPRASAQLVRQIHITL